MSARSILDTEARVCFDGGMTSTHTHRPAPTPGTIVVRRDATGSAWQNYEVTANPNDELVLAPDEFVVTALHSGYRWIARFNDGPQSTRRFWDLDMLRVDLYDIETVSLPWAYLGDDGEPVESFSIRGVKGAHFKPAYGTSFYIRPDYTPKEG